MSEITLFKNKVDCAGCGACFATCPCNAISMMEDEYGCKYPSIKTSLCIQCKKCLTVCDYQQIKLENKPIAAIAAKALDKQTESKSASGGIFATLAYDTLSRGGCVAGAVLDLQMNKKVMVYHMLSEDSESVEKMQGSKYVQSDAWRSYKDIVTAVKAGREVLFCGTPCQVAAIKRITGNPSNFITIDLICHGVPSGKMLEDYFNILSKTLRGRIIGFWFRDKTCHKDWTSKITIARGKKKRSYFIHSQYISFYKYFLGSVIYRENCYSCPYARLERNSDITIGDYWGIEDFHKGDIGENTKNWSCVLINTEKGKLFFDFHSEGIQKLPSKVEWVAASNHQLRHPSEKRPEREAVLESYRTGGYKKVEHEYRKTIGGELRYRYRLLREIYRNRKQ